MFLGTESGSNDLCWEVEEIKVEGNVLVQERLVVLPN
jgi:hypothetical protein